MDHGAIVRDYAALRSVAVRLNNRLTERLSGEEIDAAAEALGMRHGKNIEFETEDEMCVLMDYAIHTVRRDGRSAVDRLLADDPPPEGSDELVLLRSLKASRYSVFETHGPIPGVGVTGFEGPARTPILLVDIGFSRTARRGYAMATRLHCPRGEWWMTTGAALPLNDGALGRIIRETEEHQRRFGSEPSGHVRSTMIIRACIASGASRQIVYAPPGRAPAPGDGREPLRSSRVGRNEGCPCGSGRKYKKCCGT